MPRPELEGFIQMRDAVVQELEEAETRMAELRAEGKVKTATYQQLFARKMTLGTMIDLYKDYGLL